MHIVRNFNGANLAGDSGAVFVALPARFNQYSSSPNPSEIHLMVIRYWHIEYARNSNRCKLASEATFWWGSYHQPFQRVVSIGKNALTRAAERYLLFSSEGLNFLRKV